MTQLKHITLPMITHVMVPIELLDSLLEDLDDLRCCDTEMSREWVEETVENAKLRVQALVNETLKGFMP